MLISADENITGLELSDISFTVVLTGSSTDVSDHVLLVSLTGDNSSWELSVRPPAANDFPSDSGEITLTIAADSVDQGNPETTHVIRFSSEFPDPDAEVPTSLFDVSLDRVAGIAVSPTRIIISNTSDSVFFYTHDGTEQTADEMDLSGRAGRLDYFNNGFLLSDAGPGSGRYAIGNTTRIENYPIGAHVHTRFGFLQSPPFKLLPYGKTASADVIDIDSIGFSINLMAYQNDLLYGFQRNNATGGFLVLAKIPSDDTIALVRHLNIDAPHNSGSNIDTNDIAIYRDSLYFVLDNDLTGTVYTLDIRKYRPMSMNTKTTIYPVFANEGDTIDLTQYSPDAERIVPDVGFDKPDYLTFNTSNELVIDTNAVTETHPVYIPLKAINRIDATETGTFGFYLIIQQATNPIWREFADLSMPADSVFNLFDVVEGADRVSRSNSGPTGASVSNGRLTIGTTVSGTVVVRATNDSRKHESHLYSQRCASG